MMHYLYRPNPHSRTLVFDSDLEHVKRRVLDGAIMQAPVSDREAILWVLTEGIGGKTPSEIREIYGKLEKIAKEADRENRETESPFDTMLPLSLTSQIYPANTPLSARRFLSLVSPESPQSPREDDLFSSDIGEEELAKTFGMIKQQGLLKDKMLVLYSGADQSVPDWVDKEKLLSRWRDAADHNGRFQICDQEHSGIIPGASHALSNDDQAEPRKDLVRRVLGYLQGLEES